MPDGPNAQTPPASGRPTNRKLRSRITTDGLDRVAHRAFMRAMGLDSAAIARPMIGVVTTEGEMTPCNMGLAGQAEFAKRGIAEAGGTPREFRTISVSDGISMQHQGMKFSLLSREIIADSVEAVVRGHAYDALVCFAGCDKTLPGMMMAMTPPQRAVGLHLWRLHAARHTQRRGCDGADGLRRRRRRPGRHNAGAGGQ